MNLRVMLYIGGFSIHDLHGQMPEMTTTIMFVGRTYLEAKLRVYAHFNEHWLIAVQSHPAVNGDFDPRLLASASSASLVLMYGGVCVYVEQFVRFAFRSNDVSVPCCSPASKTPFLIMQLPRARRGTESWYMSGYISEPVCEAR